MPSSRASAIARSPASGVRRSCETQATSSRRHDSRSRSRARDRPASRWCPRLPAQVREFRRRRAGRAPRTDRRRRTPARPAATPCCPPRPGGPAASVTASATTPATAHTMPRRRGHAGQEHRPGHAERTRHHRDDRDDAARLDGKPERGPAQQPDGAHSGQAPTAPVHAAAIRTICIRSFMTGSSPSGSRRPRPSGAGAAGRVLLDLVPQPAHVHRHVDRSPNSQPHTCRAAPHGRTPGPGGREEGEQVELPHRQVSSRPSPRTRRAARSTSSASARARPRLRPLCPPRHGAARPAPAG